MVLGGVEPRGRGAGLYFYVEKNTVRIGGVVFLKSNIRAERARLNLSQADVANAIGIHVNMISRYESGENEPSASVLVRMAAFFGCSPDYLLGLCDERHGHIEISKQ